MIKNRFSENKIEVLEWPAQSLQLNPIEHLWGDAKKIHELAIVGVASPI